MKIQQYQPLPDGFVLQDNFLSQPDFDGISKYVTGYGTNFSWAWSEYAVTEDEEESPGHFVHTAYYGSVPISDLYNKIAHTMIQRLRCCCLYRIKLNLNPRLPEPFKYAFHSDLEHILEDEVSAHWTTAIFYFNTNNGYTEFEDGTIIKNVANRIVEFPSHIKHRGVSQTDTKTRILMNINYLKAKPKVEIR